MEWEEVTGWLALLLPADLPYLLYLPTYLPNHKLASQPTNPPKKRKGEGLFLLAGEGESGIGG